MPRFSKQYKVLTILMVTALLGACGQIRSLSFPGVYRINIVQGNRITQEMVDQLRPGLTKRQVSFILGNPLIKDTFDQDRWDYVYGVQIAGGERTQERLTVYFEDGQLASFDGDFTQTPEKTQFEQSQTSENNQASLDQ